MNTQELTQKLINLLSSGEMKMEEQYRPDVSRHISEPSLIEVTLSYQGRQFSCDLDQRPKEYKTIPELIAERYAMKAQEWFSLSWYRHMLRGGGFRVKQAWKPEPASTWMKIPQHERDMVIKKQLKFCFNLEAFLQFEKQQ